MHALIGCMAIYGRYCCNFSVVDSNRFNFMQLLFMFRIIKIYKQAIVNLKAQKTEEIKNSAEYIQKCKEIDEQNQQKSSETRSGTS